MWITRAPSANVVEVHNKFEELAEEEEEAGEDREGSKTSGRKNQQGEHLLCEIYPHFTLRSRELNASG